MPSRRTKLQMFIQISNIDILISSGFSIYSLGKPICASPHQVFPVAFQTVPLLVLMMMASRPCFQGGLWSASSFCTPLLRAVSGVMSLTLCPQVVTQSSFGSSQVEASHLWFASTGAFEADVEHCHMPAWGFHSTFCSKLFESVKMMYTCKGFECNLARFFNQHEVFCERP